MDLKRKKVQYPLFRLFLRYSHVSSRAQEAFPDEISLTGVMINLFSYIIESIVRVANMNRLDDINECETL